MWYKSKEEKVEDRLFTKIWMDNWMESINNSAEFYRRAKSWNAPLILTFNPPPQIIEENDSTGIYLNLKYGKCEELRYSKEIDESRCDVILSADTQTWIQLMEKGADPASMILKKKITLKKGSLILLSTQSKAAKALLKSAPISDRKSSQEEKPLMARERNKFYSTTEGLDINSTSMKLFRQKSKRDWTKGIDLKKDAEEWEILSAEKKKVIAHFMSHILAFEESAIKDQLPIMQVVAQNSDLDDYMLMTSILSDDSNHLVYLSKYKNEVMGKSLDLVQYHASHFKSLLYNKIPFITGVNDSESTTAVLLKSLSLINIILKGTLTNTYYIALQDYLDENKILPALFDGVTKIKEDESYHDNFTQFFIAHLLSENSDLIEFTENTLEEFLTDTTNIIQENFTFYAKKDQFAAKKEWLLNQTIVEYQKRFPK